MSKIKYSKTCYSSDKKLYQTKISSYFSSCVKTTPLYVNMSQKKKNVSRSKKRLSFSKSSDTPSPVKNINLYQDIIFSVPKRKLPVSILSEDEDSDNDCCTTSPPKRVAVNSHTPIKSECAVKNNQSEAGTSFSTPVNVNISLPKKSPSGKPPTRKVVNSPKSLKKIKVLKNVVIKTPKKSPKDVKHEKKKISYEQLKVIQDFFQKILENRQFLNLLSTNDKEILHKFFEMEKEYKYVCVKLFMWQQNWYNIFKFVERVGLTMEETKVLEMYNTLKNNNFVETNYMGEDLFTLLNLLSLKDVREIARTFKLSDVRGTKDSIISKLLKTSKTQNSLHFSLNSEDVLKQKANEKLGYCVKISKSIQRCIYYVYVLNTFTNTNLMDPQDYFKDVSFMNAVFPSFNIEHFCIFYTPQEFSRFADAVKLRSDLLKAIQKKNVLNMFEICKSAFEMLKQVNETRKSFDTSRQPYLEYYTATAQYVYILSTGAKHVKSSHFEDVLIWYEYLLSQGFCKHKRGDWYADLVLIYAQYKKKYEKAARLLLDALKKDKEYFSDIQLQELVHRGKMLNKKTYDLPPLLHDEIVALFPISCERDWPKDVLSANSVICDQLGRRRMYSERCENGDVNYLTVEQIALKYYKSVGFPNGEHCEGSLINASFCLLFWDIIYDTYVKGTFISKLQTVPLDMYTKYFYTNRESEIKQRLTDIEKNWSDEVFTQKIVETWTLHSHESALCLLENVIKDPQCLLDVISCIGRNILTKIFQRLVKNYKLYHSGFPDLIVWNTREKKAKFVEVKSENDKLSFKQKLWLNYLMDAGASVAVCYVEPKSSKKKLAIERNSSTN